MKAKEIKPFLDDKMYCTVTRSFEEEDEMLSGVPVALSPRFLVLHEISEFYLYGFTVLPLDTIEEIHQDAADQFIDQILRAEGIMDKVGLNHSVDLASWMSLFSSLEKTDLTVTLQCEELNEDYFFIGKVKRVDEDAVWIHHFDSEGVLSETWDLIPFESINKVGFDEPFANMLSRHLRNLN